MTNLPPSEKNHIIVNTDGTAWILTARGDRILVDAADIQVLEPYKWYGYRGRKTRYAGAHVRRANGKDRVVNLHTLLIYGILETKAPEVDHINENGLDNRRCNLRPATPGENRCNRGKTRANNSGYKGVVWNGRRWTARIGVNGVQHHLGVFDDPAEGARAYDAAVRQFHGDFGSLNFPNVGVKP